MCLKELFLLLYKNINIYKIVVNNCIMDTVSMSKDFLVSKEFSLKIGIILFKISSSLDTIKLIVLGLVDVFSITPQTK